MDELEQKILDVINKSNLPTECKAYVLKHVYTLATHSIEVERLKAQINKKEDGDEQHKL